MTQTLDRIKTLIDKFGHEKNEEIFPICISQVAVLYARDPAALHPLVFNVLKKLMVSKQPYQRSLAASLFERIIEKVHEHHSSDAFFFPQSLLKFNLQEFIDSLDRSKRDKAKPEANYDRFVQLDILATTQDSVIKFMSKKDNFLYSKSEKKIQAKEKMSKLKLNGENDDQYIEELNEKLERDEDLDQLAKGEHHDDKRGKHSLLDTIDSGAEGTEGEAVTGADKGNESRRITLFDAVYAIARHLVFHANWEYRHGALLVFRSISRKLGKISSAGWEAKGDGRFVVDRDADHRVISINGRTLEDISARINEDMKQKCLILLALDRFSDFLSDKSNMTHRSLAGEILVTLFANHPNVDKFFFIFEFLFLPNKRFDWEPRQAFVFLLKKLLKKDIEQQALAEHPHSSAVPRPVGLGLHPPAAIKKTGSVHSLDLAKPPLLERKFVERMAKMVLEILPEHEEVADICAQFGTAMAQSRFWPIEPKFAEAFQARLMNKLRELDDIGYLPRAVFEHFSLMLAKQQLSTQVADGLEELLRKFIFHDNADVRLELFTFVSNLLTSAPEMLTQTNLEFIYVAVIFQYLSRLDQGRAEAQPEAALRIELAHILDVLKLVLSRVATQRGKFEMIAIIFRVMDRQDFTVVVQSFKVNFSYNIEKPLTIRPLEVIELATKLISSLDLGQISDLYAYLQPIAQTNTLTHVPFMLCPTAVRCVPMPQVQSFLDAEPRSIALTYLNDLASKAISDTENFLYQNLVEVGIERFPRLEQLVEKMLKCIEDTAEHKGHLVELRDLLGQVDRELTILIDQNKISSTNVNLVLILKQKVLPLYDQVVAAANEYLSLVRCAGAAGYMEKCVSGQAKIDTSNNNKIIQPLLLLSLTPMPAFFADVATSALYKFIPIYRHETKHPNHKILGSVLKKCLDIPAFAQNVRGYFRRIFEDFSWMAPDQFPALVALFENERLCAEYVDLTVAVRDVDGRPAFAGRFMALLRGGKASNSEAGNRIICAYFETLSQEVLDGRTDLMDELLLWLLDEVRARKLGAFSALKSLLERVKKSFIPYAKMFLKETIRAINEAYEGEKSVVFDVFSTMLTLSHLDIELPALAQMDPQLVQLYQDGRQFLFEFKNPSNFDVDLTPVLNNALNRFALRDYQVEGVKWISFLFRYGLSASLCDDMGLGKTLQSLCAVALTHRAAILQPGGQSAARPVSLIVCPNNLMTHWARECSNYISPALLNPALLLSNSVSETNPVSKLIAASPATLYITSYNALNRIRDYLDYKFKVIVIDEAHLIRNPKNKTSISVRQLSSEVRLALTGTPIQNKITELWSIFDFLMPMYLGRNDEFNREFRSLLEMSLLTIDLSKMHLSEAQQAVLNNLHKKVLPFIMRREKGDVLKDLPDKIIQDYFCEMSEAQAGLYAELAKDFKPEDQGPVEGEEELTKKSFFSVLSSMRKLLNHPSFLDPGRKPQAQPKKQSGRQKKGDAGQAAGEDVATAPARLGKRGEIDGVASDPLRENPQGGFYEQSGKFTALRDLFKSLDFNEDDIIGCTNNPNKSLLFTRSNDTLSLILLFFRQVFPFIKVLSLNHTQTQFQRAEVVDQFNRDKEVKVLVLTPKIGGLGLNLHTANIVVMFDHDFNPMNDLQAMDRAHRLGQKNVVNVYRLITLGTIEEQILGIQRFKLSVARTVINAENTSIRNVQDSNFLKLIDNFAQENVKEAEKQEEAAIRSFGGFGKYFKSLEMAEGWDENEYGKEYLE